MKRYIKSSKDGESDLAVSIDELEDDFSYIISGLEKLSRIGSQSEKEALSIALKLSGMLSEITDEISTTIVG